MIRRLFLLLLAGTTCQATDLWADDGPAKEVPELQVLSNYIGTWDVAITSQDSPFAKGESTATWILDGRFLQQTGVLKSSNGATSLKVTTVMTYDPNLKTYRMWSFLSNGSTSEASGRWDPKSRTMTSVSSHDGTTTTTTAKFTEAGTEEWMIISTNKNNEVIGRIGGANTRRKP